MTVAHDADSVFADFTTTTPATVSHTPAGTPRAVVIYVAHGTESTDLITGTVSYGGVALTRIPTNGFAQDTVDEPGAAYLYFLGSGIPTGTQSASIGHSGSATTKTAAVVTFTAAADCEIGASGRLQENQANPQIALDTGANSSLRLAGIYTGLASPTTLVDLTGQTTLRTKDFGAFGSKISSQDTAATGSVTIGWTASTDDVAMVAAAIQEISGATTVTPAVVATTTTVPTPTVLAASVVTPSVVAGVFAVPAASVLAAAVVTPATVATTTTVPTPSVLAGSVVTPAVVAVSIAVPTPTVSTEAVATPAAVATSATIPTPTVLAAAVVAPGVIGAVVTVPSPNVLTEAATTPATVATSVTVPTPVVLAGSTVTPDVVVAVMTVPTPVAGVVVPPVVQGLGLGTSRIRRYSSRRIKNRPAMWGR